MSKEREKAILEKLLKNKKVTVKELARELYISEPSVRRDLMSLENQNLIKRIHGGAVLEESALSKTRIPFIVRELEESGGKLLIAKQAAELVKDGNVIFLDASTSAYNVIDFLADKKGITVVTNGVKALLKLAECGINTISTGGALVSSCLALVGEEAYKTVERINADVAFFSCRGVSCDGALTDISPEENYIRIKMIENSASAYALLTADKWGKKYYHNLCKIRDIDGVICENKIAKENIPPNPKK